MRDRKDTIQIDGAMGEGGGQIIRTAVSLSAITGKPTEIQQIRARRSKPGLQAQHLTSVRAAAALCRAELRGAELGSQFLRFMPTMPVQGGRYEFDVAEARAGGSAGATGLVLQTVAVPLATAQTTETKTEIPVSVGIGGGTHVPMSPGADFLAHVYLPALRAVGIGAKLSLERAGFFPKGGGRIEFSLLSGIDASETGFRLTERGKLRRFTAVITTAELPEHVAERGFAQLKKELADYGVPIIPVFNRFDTASERNGAGAALLLVAECEKTVCGWQSLGERGKPMERVATDAARGFKKWFPTECGTDEHLADQLVLPAALFTGESRWTTSCVSEHLRTVITVVRQFLDSEVEIECAEREDGTGTVMVKRISTYR